MNYNYKTKISGPLDGHLTLEQVILELVKDPTSVLRDLIEELRSYPKGSKEFNSLKEKLPVYYYNCIFNTTSAKDLNKLVLTNDFFLDIDCINSNEELLAKQKQFSLLPFVKACYVSCSGKGLHIIVSLIGMNINNLAQIHSHLNQTYFEGLLDVAPKNINRAAYLSHDANAYLNSKAKALSLSKEISLGALAEHNNPLYNTIVGLCSAKAPSEQISKLIFLSDNTKKMKIATKKMYYEDGTEIKEEDFFMKDAIVSKDRKLTVLELPKFVKRRVKAGRRNGILCLVCKVMIQLNPEIDLESLYLHLKGWNRNFCEAGTSNSEIAKIAIHYDENRSFKPIKGKKQYAICNKSLSKKAKQTIGSQITAEIKVDKSKTKIKNAIEELFNDSKAISYTTLSEVTLLNRSTIRKYYKEFKEEIEAYNQQLNINQNGTRKQKAIESGTTNNESNNINSSDKQSLDVKRINQQPNLLSMVTNNISGSSLRSNGYSSVDNEANRRRI